jgi:glycosyltransferase involved in cell wall biosynthesis
VVVPSLFPETFGYVVLEAFAVRTPVVVQRGGGAIQETGEQSGGGLGYETEAELLVALRRVIHDDSLREELAEAGFAMRKGPWSEEAHLRAYLELIEGCRRNRGGSTPHTRATVRPGAHRLRAPR